MTKNEARKKSAEKEAFEQTQAIKAIWRKTDEEDREATEDELRQVDAHLKAVDQLKEKIEEIDAAIAVEQRVEQTAREMGPTKSVVGPKVTLDEGDRGIPQMKSLGEQFVGSQGYKKIQSQMKSGGLSGQWSTGLVEMNTKGTLLEGTAGSGAGLIPVPQVVPGVVNKLFQRLTIADLLDSGSTSTNSLRYVVEGTATSGAAGVAEAGLKPQSTLGLSTVDEPVKKIATVLKTSDEMLEDAAQVQSYINGRLTLFVQIEEERQLLSGGGTNELVGILGRSGVNTYAGGTAAGNYAEQLFKGLNGTRGSALLEPSFIVMNPTDWQVTRLLKDSAGQYFGGGPFLGPYGGPQGPIGLSGQISGAIDTVWGKPVVVTSAIGAGTALIGTSAAAQVFRRSGVSVEATNSNEDDFLRNLVAIRAEERLALAVYRPSAFTKVLLA